MEVAHDNLNHRGDTTVGTVEHRYDKSVQNLVQKFEEYRANGFLVDYTVVSSDGVSFPAHKIVLCARSGYFLKYIENDPYATHELKNINSKILAILLNFLYTGQIKNMSTEDAFLCWESAIKLRVPFVIDFCSEILKENTTMKNCVDILLKSAELKSERLVKHCIGIIQRNFRNFVTHSDEFVKLSGDVMTRILSLRTLNGDEDDVFKAFCSWREANPSASQSSLESVFDCILMDRLSQNSLRYIVKAQCNQKCFSWCIDKALDLHGTSQIEQALPRRLDDVLTLVNNFKRACISYYDLQSNEWIKLENNTEVTESQCPFITFNSFNEKQSVIYDSEVIMVTGGINQSHDATNSSWIYRMDKRKWTEGPPLNKPRNSHAGCKFRDYFYIIGGYGAKESVERLRYNKSGEIKWEKVRSLNEGRLLHCCTSLRISNIDQLMVVGGCNETMSNTAEAYNYLKGEWAMLAPMNHQRLAATFGVSQNRFYIFSMINESYRNGEMYDPATNQWTTLDDLSFFPLTCQMIEIDKTFYGLAKADTNGNVCVVKFDIRNNQWRIVNSDGPTLQPSLVLHKLTGYKIDTNYTISVCF